MSAKKRMIIFFTISAVVILITALLIIFHPQKAQSNIKPTSLTPQEQTDDTYLDSSLYNEDIGAYEDEDSYPYKIMVVNKNDILQNGIDIYAITSLEEYLERYVTYYTTINEPFWEAEYVKNSFKDDHNRPSFKIQLRTPDNDLTIKCVYKPEKQRYKFYSELEE